VQPLWTAAVTNGCPNNHALAHACENGRQGDVSPSTAQGDGRVYRHLWNIDARDHINGAVCRANPSCKSITHTQGQCWRHSLEHCKYGRHSGRLSHIVHDDSFLPVRGEPPVALNAFGGAMTKRSPASRAGLAAPITTEYPRIDARGMEVVAALESPHDLALGVRL